MAEHKIKFVLGILGLVTALSVYSFFSSAKLPYSQTAAIGNTQQLGNTDSCQTDTDKDGLADCEESYWGTDYQNPDTDGDGFKDGEEVASGHDPMVKGPDDLINKPQNVTQKISGLLVGGLTEGSLQPDSANFSQSVDQLVDEILNQSDINLQDVPQSSLTIVDQNDQNVKIYSQNISPLLKIITKDDPVGIKGLLESFQAADSVTAIDHPALARFFSTEIPKLQNQVTQLEAMPVPKDWTASHIQLIALLKRVIKSYQAIQAVNNDPLQAITGLTNVLTLLFDELPNVVVPYAKIYKE